MESALKLYIYGFSYPLVLSLFSKPWTFFSNENDWRYLLLYILILPVFGYITVKLSFEFTNIPLFSKESFFRYIALFIGLISCMTVLISLGLFEILA